MKKKIRYYATADKFLDGEIIREGKKEYYADFMTFDIETTNIKRLQQSVMYLWAIHFNKRTYFGRTWKEFRKLCYYINQHAKAKVVCYIQNLSFEFQFFRGVLDFGDDNVFLLDQRKVLRATYGMIEFRCSYLLTNMSLGLFLDTMKVKNPKLKYNYSKYRYPWSQLQWIDYRYNANDVIGLYQALRKYIFDINGDDLITTPMTSTGYVRRDIKKVLKEQYNQEHLRRIQPNMTLLTFLREAFRGGDTHLSRYYYSTLLPAIPGNKVISEDEKSAYPAVMMCHKYPMTPFSHVGHITEETLKRKISSGNRAMIMRVAIYNIELRDNDFGSPYLSFSKCRNAQNYILDNGRILEADYLETTITDVDYRILRDIYTWKAGDFIIVDSYQSTYGKLPECVRSEIMTYFYNKEMLKKTDPELYMKSKNKLNSIYGMTVQNPLKIEYKFTSSDNEYHEKVQDFDKIISDLIKKKFLPYQVGVWVTCWARMRLHRGRQCLNHPLDFVYCDTDSIKFLDERNIKNFEKLNEQLKREAIENDAYFIDDDGIGHYLGVYEFDGAYTQFISLGAKKYCYRDAEDHKLHLTLAGVSKKGVSELSNNIRNFQEGFIFKRSAGLKAKYNDHVDFKTKIDGHELRITSNVYLEKTTYEIRLTEDYEKCVEIAKKLLHDR